jgi:hypothetical protein
MGPINIYFYIDKKGWIDKLSKAKADEYQQNYFYLASSTYHWTVQTYLRLKEHGFSCLATETLPDEGIIVANRFYLPDKLKPNDRQLFVHLKADNRRHPYAQLHVICNPCDPLLTQQRGGLWQAHYIPAWPQIGLIPRDHRRGNRFENIAHIGGNLAPELCTNLWKKKLNSIGLKWEMRGQDRLNDFSDIDAIVSVRSFDNRQHTNKPATKLYNAWMAGVPAVFGPESAVRAERKSEFDYFEVRSPEEAFLAVKRLKEDEGLRNKIIKNASLRASELAPENYVSRWKYLLTEVAPEAYEGWRSLTVRQRRVYFFRRFMEYKIEGAFLRIMR